MSKDPNELTEAELAEMSPNDRAWYERILAQEARDAAEAANEVPVVFSGDMARELVAAIQRDLDGSHNYLNHPARDDAITMQRINVLCEARDLITEAMRAKGMV